MACTLPTRCLLNADAASDRFSSHLSNLRFRYGTDAPQAPKNSTVKPRQIDIGCIHLAFDVRNLKELVAEAKKIGWHPAGDDMVRFQPGDGSTRGVCTSKQSV
jgi:hypothetical protein